ncbi:MAG: DUF4286 family protein [Paludibacteraceae bacterium]
MRMKCVVFNTTYHVNRAYVERWLDFVKQHVKPRIEQHVAFSDYRICKVLIADQPDDEAFALQFSAENKSVIDHWLETEGHLLNAYMHKTFGENVLSFSVFMEEIAL